MSTVYKTSYNLLVCLGFVKVGNTVCFDTGGPDLSCP